MKVLVVSLLALSALAACRPDTITLAYDFEEGAELTYQMTARARASWDIGREGSGGYTMEIDVTEVFESVDEEGATVEVTMRPTEVVENGLPSPGPDDRTFRLRLDRAGAVVDVLEVDGIEASVLGPNEVAFIGTYRPPLPSEPVRMRDRWVATTDVSSRAVDQRVETTGLLQALQVIDGRHVALIDYSGQGPLRWTTRLAQGDAELSGSATTSGAAQFDLDAGSLRSATSSTTSLLDVLVLPETGEAPINGTVELDLDLEVRAN